MQKWIRKQKRRAQKTKNRIFELFSLFIKVGLSALVLFIVFIFFIFSRTNATEANKKTETKQHEADITLNEASFIEGIKPYAKNAEATHGVWPSLLVAQAALESDWGRSSLSLEANNYFGIKGTTNSALYTTREFTNSEWLTTDASFKKYNTMEDSVRDYADLLKFGTSWDNTLYHGVIDAENYRQAAVAIQDAGYATDPNYADKLIKIIEQYQLYELDEVK